MSPNAERVIIKLCMTVYKCLHVLAPQYLAELCVPVADVAGRRQLRSASRGLLNFPRYNKTNYGRRAFSFTSPYAWNSLPENVQQSPSVATSVLSQCTCLTDGRTDRILIVRPRLHSMQRGKNVRKFTK